MKDDVSQDVIEHRELIAQYLEQGFDYDVAGAPPEPLKTILSAAMEAALMAMARNIRAGNYYEEESE